MAAGNNAIIITTTTTVKRYRIKQKQKRDAAGPVTNALHTHVRYVAGRCCVSLKNEPRLSERPDGTASLVTTIKGRCSLGLLARPRVARCGGTAMATTPAGYNNILGQPFGPWHGGPEPGSAA